MPVILALAAVAILGCVVLAALGRAGEMAAFPSDSAPLRVDELTATDVALLRPPLALWGYNVSATEEALGVIARSVTARDVEIATLRRELEDLRAGREPHGLRAADPREFRAQEDTYGSGAGGAPQDPGPGAQGFHDGGSQAFHGGSGSQAFHGGSGSQAFHGGSGSQTFRGASGAQDSHGGSGPRDFRGASGSLGSRAAGQPQGSRAGAQPPAPRSQGDTVGGTASVSTASEPDLRVSRDSRDVTAWPAQGEPAPDE